MSIIAQGINEPITPMGIEIFRLFAVCYLKVYGSNERYPPWFLPSAGRVFVDYSNLLGKKKYWSKIAKSLSNKDTIASKALLDLLEKNEHHILIPKNKFPMSIGIIKYALHIFKAYIIGWLDYKKAHDMVYKVGNNLVEKAKSISENITTTDEALKCIENIIVDNSVELLTNLHL